MINSLRGIFARVAAAFGHDKISMALLERGITQEQRDQMLLEAIEYRDSERLVGIILEKGTGQAARNEALYEAMLLADGLEKTSLLLSAGTSEKGREAALRHTAALGSPGSHTREKTALLTSAGISLEGYARAIGKAAEFGNTDALEVLFDRIDHFNNLSAPEKHKLEETAVRDIRRRDLTIGVESLLKARSLLPEP